jgi:hypothetical protein
MDFMFENAVAFHQIIEFWDVASVVRKVIDFWSKFHPAAKTFPF